MKDELDMGVEVEKEHKDTYLWIKSYYDEHGKFPPADEVYRSIAVDHIRENPSYYSKLLKAKL